MNSPITPGDDQHDEGSRDSVDSHWQQRGVQIVGSLALLAVATGTIVYRWLEGWGWVDSLYFSVVTLTTVGYGDLSPTSSGSKLFTVFYIIFGISLFGAFVNNLVKQRAKRAARRHAGK